MGDMRAGQRQQRQMLSDQRRGGEFMMARHRADPDRVARQRDAEQLRHMVEVDEERRCRQAHVERGEQALPAGQQRDAVAAVEQVEDLRQRSRPGISEIGRLHGFLPTSGPGSGRPFIVLSIK